MKNFVKQKATKAAAEPVYTNLFEVEFQTNALKQKPKQLLTEQLTRLTHDQKVPENSFGVDFLPKTLELTFNLNIIKNRIQPLALIEKLQKKLKEKYDTVTGKPLTLDIVLKMHDRFGTVNRTLTFAHCKIATIRNNNDFNYAKRNNIDELRVTLEFEKLEIKNAKKKKK